MTARRPARAEQIDPDTESALQDVMAAEHAALWSYGLVSAQLPDSRGQVATMVASHQGLRDVAADRIVAGGSTPVGPAPAYTTPEPVTDPASAIALALVIEGDCASAWRALVGATDDAELRAAALSALTDCALRMVTWRGAGDIEPRTEPFPGS